MVNSHTLLVWAFIAVCAVALSGLILVCWKYCMCKKRKEDSKKGLRGIKELEHVTIHGLSVNEKVQPNIDEVVINIEGDEDAESTKSEVKLGKLHFAVNFDFQKGELVVNVIEAADLPGMNLLRTADPYVKVYLLPDKKKKHTRVHHKTLNPIFDETFVFTVPFNAVASKILTFDVYDIDRFSRHALIGQVQVPLYSVDLGVTSAEWRDLATENEEENSLGDICFSLGYRVATEELNVIIYEAKNLQKTDVGGLPDPYVKISLMQNGERIKKKKTTIQKSTLNPCYKETFKFKVPVAKIQDVSLNITVVDHDSSRASGPIGTVIVGCNSTDTEPHLWNDMLARRPTHPVVRWYTLQEVPEKSLKDQNWIC